MKNIQIIAGLVLPFTVLTACTTTPEPIEIIEVKPPEIVQTCVSVNTLTRVVIPAETKSGFYITSIESPPTYRYDAETGKTVEVQTPPIESKVPYTKIIKSEQIIYVNSESKEITDICEPTDRTIVEELAPDPVSEENYDEVQPIAQPVTQVTQETLPDVK